MKKNYVRMAAIILAVVALCTFAVIKLKKGNGNTRIENNSIKVVKEEFQKTIQDLKDGKYNNLVAKTDVKSGIDEIENIYDIRIKKDMTMYNKTDKENLQRMMTAIESFYGKDYDYSAMTAGIYNEKDEYVSMPLEEFKSIIEDGSFAGNKYVTLFKDTREIGEKGFTQLDPGFFTAWFSRGELEETLPMMSCDTQKIYNLTTGKGDVADKIKLQGEETSIEEAIAYVENFLNNELPYEKNKEFLYKVAEARVMKNDKQEFLGFCVRRTYEGVPFDYIDGLTEGIYNSDFDDDRGEVCIAKAGEIDNFCGLGGVNDSVVKESESIKDIVSLDSALRIISDSIGDNSVYEIYGVEIVYQLTKETIEDENPNYEQTGVAKWKIMSRNENDDKYTWFYVDIKSGDLSYRFQKNFEG